MSAVQKIAREERREAMEVEERKLIRALSEDLAAFKMKVDGMEGMLEPLIERYTDAFYEVRGEYLEKLERLRQDGVYESFKDIADLKRAIEAD
jgi:hypothetical protein